MPHMANKPAFLHVSGERRAAWSPKLEQETEEATRTRAPRKGKLHQNVPELPGRTEVWMRRRLIRRIAPRSVSPIPLPANYVSTQALTRLSWAVLYSPKRRIDCPIRSSN